MENLALDNLNVPYEKREMALEYMNQVKNIFLPVQFLFVTFIRDFFQKKLRDGSRSP